MSLSRQSLLLYRYVVQICTVRFHHAHHYHKLYNSPRPYSPAVDLFLFSFFFSSRRRHTRLQGDWSSDVCSSDLSRSAEWMFTSSMGILLLFSMAGVVVWIIHSLAGWLRAVGPVKLAGAILRGADQIGRASCRERV